MKKAFRKGMLLFISAQSFHMIYQRGNDMKRYDVDKRCMELGQYIAESGATVRQTAEVFGVSKSTVHMDVTKRLREIAPALAGKVEQVLSKNKAERHLRGGAATREKYTSHSK
jgi:putative DeoR family transcriptional regulator (stage III sporulation protein D)